MILSQLNASQPLPLTRHIKYVAMHNTLTCLLALTPAAADLLIVTVAAR